GYPTHVWNQVIQDPAVAPLSQHPRVTAVPGGYAIFENGLLIGGIGVSGGDAEQDQRACEAALEASPPSIWRVPFFVVEVVRQTVI
ncbi:MAG: heme-binding protein, partial [Sphingomonadales bacterium]|nr:heme-binding protein [Sphingomonadales bacterium]